MKKRISFLIGVFLLAIPTALLASDEDTPPATSLPLFFDQSQLLSSSETSSNLVLGSDVVVSNLSGNQSEVTIGVNPTNSQNLVIVGHAAGGFSTMDTFYSTDGGQTWTRVALGNADDGFTSTFRFDPTVAFDANGNVYVGYGVSDFSGATKRESVVVCKSTNGGQSYGTFRTLSTQNSIGTLPGNDKWMLATGRDNVNANQQNVYIAWTQNATEGASTDQRIVVSRSTDGGNTWSAPLIIADDAIAGIDRALGADPAVGPNGEVYVAWHDFGDAELLVDRSTDGGVTWGTDHLISTVAFSGLDITIPPQPDRGVGPMGNLDVDRSGGAHNGRLYCVYMNGTSPDTDIFCRTSDDGGSNWSSAVKVNDDATSRSQFLPWCDLDDSSGNLSVVFYDARDDAANQKVNVYHALSTNGGTSFGANTRVSDNPSDQSTANGSRTGNNFLEYIGVAATSCVAYTVWSDNSADPADLDYYFDFIPLESTPPIITCPGNIVVQCAETGGTSASNAAIAAFLNGVSASDNCDTTPTITNNAPSFFPDGTTSVTFTARDDAGNSASCSADVTVVDTVPPLITYCPVDTVVECSSHCGVAKADLAGWLAGFKATDTCDDTPTLSNDAPTCFPDGETTVTFTAEDDSHNVSTCEAKLTVQDTKPPVITVVLDRDVLWPPNHKLVEVCADVTVTDICDPNPTFVLTGITSSEPDNAKGDGNTVDDIQNDATGTPDLCYDLRSERQGGGDGRTYSIIYTATDASGNTAADTVCVQVPHDHSSGAFASTGFAVDGTSLENTADRFVVIVPGSDVVDAARLDMKEIFLGNTAFVARPTQRLIVDVNGDQQFDAALFFDADAMALIRAYAENQSLQDGTDGALSKTVTDGPVGIHFLNQDGVDFLVSNIFALGDRVNMPAVGMVDPPAPLLTSGGDPVVPSRTELASIHPNPFNPETTVDFSLASSERVQIAIYDVRGALVRRLVDGTMPAGQHHATWNGRDNSGRTASSGIYFVRMIAGRYEEVRKIVMLK
ncbi:MAG TPA: HYR domain-containing protein [Candidatus Krumholzibacteria bacterium]|nr:HYR domain-containing protein [Candidatus Krumholzibacteria bacterium]